MEDNQRDLRARIERLESLANQKYAEARLARELADRLREQVNAMPVVISNNIRTEAIEPCESSAS